MKCKVCGKEAAVALKGHNAAFCEECYPVFFRRQIKRGIESQKLFDFSEKILVALSGGKDSLSLMLELVEMGYRAEGLFIDLAIPESSAEARATTEDFCRERGLTLTVIDLAKEGLPIPQVKKRLRRPVCSVCGKIKRYYFNRAALMGGFDCLATGHNLDDETSRLFGNVLRWDRAYLADQGPRLDAADGFVRRAKPLWRLTEFETANYAFIRGIPHHTAPCPYSRGASFSELKNVLRGLERIMPGKKLDFYQGFLERGGPVFAASEAERERGALKPCARCGSPTSADDLCGVCRVRLALAEEESD